MSESPTPPNDFTPDPSLTETTSKQSNGLSRLVLVLAGVGCGCLGLIVLGIVAAIALPSFLNQANKAKEAEAKADVGSMLRGQQAFYLEKAKFSTTIEDLQIGVSSETEHYSYKIVPTQNGQGVFVYAKPKQTDTHGFAGAIYAVGNDPTTATTYSGLCKSDEVGKAPTDPPALDTDMAPPVVVCPPGSSSAN